MKFSSFWPLLLVWFAGATPESRAGQSKVSGAQGGSHCLKLLGELSGGL